MEREGGESAGRRCRKASRVSVAVLLVLALLGASTSPSSVGYPLGVALAAGTVDPCSYLVTLPDKNFSALAPSEWASSFHATAVCNASYGYQKSPDGKVEGPILAVQIDAHASAADADTLRQELLTGKIDGSPIWGTGGKCQALTGYGDGAVDCVSNPSSGGTTRHTIFFTRNCLSFLGELVKYSNTDPKWEQTLKDYATKVDASFVKSPACNAPAPAVAATARPMQLGLACDQSRLTSGGFVTCTAATTNAPAGASLIYTWQLDRVIDAKQTESVYTNPSQITDTDLHTLTVRVRDTKSGVSAGPEIISFARGLRPAAPITSGAAGSSAGSSSGGPGSAVSAAGTPSLPPLTSGPALAVAGALAALVSYRFGRRGARPPAVVAPTRPKDTPTPARLIERPPGSAESSGQEPNEDPTVRIELLVSGSARTESEALVWGDNADIAFLGCRVVVEPASWCLDEAHTRYEFSATGGDCVPVQYFDRFRPGSHFRDPTEERRVVARFAWTNANALRPVRVSVWGQVTPRAGAFNPRPFHLEAQRLVSVVGCQPSLTLLAEPPELDADGTSSTRVAPYLYAFGQPYTGGVAVVEPERAEARSPVTGAVVDLSTYAEAKPESIRLSAPGGSTPRWMAEDQVESLRLRAKLHVEKDRAMRPLTGNGLAVSFRVKPTGGGQGRGSLVDEFDFVVADHYRSCRDNLPLDYPIKPAELTLYPLRAVTEAAVARLPKDPVSTPESERLFTNRLTVRLSRSSAGGRTGDLRLDPPESLASERWGLRLQFEAGAGFAPDPDPDAPEGQETFARHEQVQLDRLRQDPMLITSCGVLPDGWLQFKDWDGKPQSWFDYDHQRFFWNPDNNQFELRDCVIRADLGVNGEGLGKEARFEVGRQLKCVLHCWDYPLWVLLRGQKPQRSCAIDDYTSLLSALGYEDVPERFDSIQKYLDRAGRAAEGGASGIPDNALFVEIGFNGSAFHIGILRRTPAGRHVWCFLKSGPRPRADATMASVRWFNRDQVIEMESRAPTHPDPEKNVFDEAKVYRDTVYSFAWRNTRRQPGATKEVLVYCPLGTKIAPP